jgi:hypothetical protein
VRAALGIAGTLLAAGASAVHQARHLSVACDRTSLERDLEVRLREVLESAPAPRRGRPPRRRAATGRR